MAFFTNKGRVYRAKAYELPEGGRDAKGQHVANLLAFQPDEHIAQVMALRTYQDAQYLVLATRSGLVKKTRLEEYDSNRTGGVIAINLREDEDGQMDELVSAELINPDQDLLLVSAKGQSVRFAADDQTLRATGRASIGVRGMKFKEGDYLLAMGVAKDDSDLLVVTEGGYAKRTQVSEYRLQGRGGLGVKVANLVSERGNLVGAVIVQEADEVMVIMHSGKVQRSNVSEVPRTGRNTKGVIFTRPGKSDAVLAIALNNETESDEDQVADASAQLEALANQDCVSAPVSAEETADSETSES